MGLGWVFSNPLLEAYWFRVTLPGLKGNMGKGTGVKQKVVILKWK